MLIALAVTVAYSITNWLTENSLKNWIFNNNFADSLILFLTLGGFINIFANFSLRKEIKKKDVENISTVKQKELTEEERINKEIEDQATF